MFKGHSPQEHFDARLFLAAETSFYSEVVQTPKLALAQV